MLLRVLMLGVMAASSWCGMQQGLREVKLLTSTGVCLRCSWPTPFVMIGSELNLDLCLKHKWEREQPKALAACPWPETQTQPLVKPSMPG